MIVNLLFSFEIFGLAFLPCSVAIDSPILQLSFWTLQQLKQNTYSSTVPSDIGPVDLRVEICEPSLNFSTLLGSQSRRELAAEELGTERERARADQIARRWRRRSGDAGDGLPRRTPKKERPPFLGRRPFGDVLQSQTGLGPVRFKLKIR
jgi:hypothetical protein